MIKNKKGQERKKRPIAVRLTAFLTALAMVFSVIYFNQNERSSKALAAPEIVTFGALVRDVSAKGSGNYTVNVPSAGAKVALITAEPSESEGGYFSDIYVKDEDADPELPKYVYVGDEVLTENAEKYKQYPIFLEKTVDTYKWYIGDEEAPKEAFQGWFGGKAVYYIASPASGSSTAVRKKYTLFTVSNNTYVHNIATNDDLKTIFDSRFTKEEDGDTYIYTYTQVDNVASVTVKTESLSDIEITSEGKTYTITDPDADKFVASEDANEFNIGEVFYGLKTEDDDDFKNSYVGADGLSDICDIINEAGCDADGTYKIKKYVRYETQSAFKTFDEHPIVRNNYILKSFSAKVEGEDAIEGDMDTTPYELTVPVTGKADPSKAITIEFTTDVDATEKVVKIDGATTDDAVSGDHEGYSVGIPASVEYNNGKDIVYTIEVSDGTATDTFDVNISFASGKPTINQEQIDGSDVDDNIQYVKADSAELSAVVTMDNTYATVEKVDLYKATSAGAVTGDVIEEKTTADDGSVSFDAALEPGINYFKMVATSSFTLTSESKLFKVFYDDKAPQLVYVEVENHVDDNYPYQYEVGRDDITGKIVNVDEGKVSSQYPLEIWIAFEDCQKDSDDTNSGSGVPFEGISDFSFNGKDYDIQARGVAYEIQIPVSEMSDFEDGGSATGSFSLTDNAGNVAEYDITFYFFNEEAEITATVEPNTTSDGYVIWDDVTDPTATIKYAISSEVPLNGATFMGTAVDLTGGLNDDTEMYEYTYTNSSFDVDDFAVSKEIKNIQFVVTNTNGYPTTNTIGVVGIDVDKPSQSSNKDASDSYEEVGDKVWHNTDLALVVTVDDGEYSSGIKSVKVTGTNNSSPTLSGGKFSAIVNESADDNGTKVTITSIDKAGNESALYDHTFFVDKTDPSASLKIGGTKYDSVAKVLSSDPKIEYSWSDSVSGIDETKTKITIDGNEYVNDKSLSGKKLSEILGTSLDPTKDYTVSLIVYDIAGNKTGTYTATFKVDSSKPVIDGKITTSAKKSTYPTYFNQDVNLSVTVTDSNIKEENITAVDQNGHTIDVTWSKTTSGYSGTISATSEGSYSIKVTATDDGKLTGSWTKAFTIDKTAPSIITKLNDYEYTSDNSYNTTVTTGVSVTDDNEDSADIKLTMVREIPGGGTQNITKSGKGPFTISDDGYYKATYTVIDKAGNSTTKEMGFTVDNTAPVNNLYVTTANPAKVDDYHNNYVNVVNTFTEHSSQENYRYGQYYNGDVTIELNYFDYNLNWVYVTDNDEEVKVRNWSYSNGYGKGSITLSEQGYHDIKIWSEDMSGNSTNDSGLGQRIRFTIDTTAPVITTNLNGQNMTNGSGTRYLSESGSLSVTVSDTNKDSYDLKREYKLTPPGGTARSGEDYISEGVESYAEEADYVVTYVAVDKAGNSSEVRTVEFRVDRTPPQLTISDVGATTTAGTVNVTFTVKEAFYQDMNSVTIKIYKKKDGSGEVLEKTIEMSPRSAADSMSYTFTDDAEYRIEFNAEDKCGNKADTNYTFIKDGTAPRILLSGVGNYDKTDKNVELLISVDEDFYTTNRVTLKGTRTDIDGKVNDITFDDFYPNRAKVTELKQMFKEDGIYDIEITSTDKAGNSSTEKVHFTIDTTAPEIGDISKYDGVKLNEFKWDLNVDDLIRDLTVCEVTLYLDGVEYDGVSDIEDGSHVLKIEAVDEMGHKSSKEVTFVLDSKAPNILVSNVEEGDVFYEARDVSVSVQLDEDTLDSVALNGKAITVTDNQASIAINEKGDYKLTAKAHDEAGNESSVEVNFTYGSEFNYWIIAIIAGSLVLLLLIALIVFKKRNA